MTVKNVIGTTIASNIVFYRKQLNMTQLELAEKLNYSDKSISKWERAEGTPDIFVLKDLADFFGITLNDMISERKVKPYSKKKQKRFSYLFALINWLVVIILYWVLSIFKVSGDWWILFVSAIPASTLTLAIFNLVWDKRKELFIYGTIFIWSLSTTLYFLIPEPNRFMIFIVFIPIYILTIMLFSIIYQNQDKKNRISK